MNLPEISENLIEQLNHGNTKAFDKIYHTYYCLFFLAVVHFLFRSFPLLYVCDSCLLCA